VIAYWSSVDSDLGTRVAAGIHGASGNGKGTGSAGSPVGSGASTGL
jgi:hypothetical protein